MHLAAHVNVWKNQSGPAAVLTGYSASRTACIRVLPERPIQDCGLE
jgi:hypothetical protein